LISQLKGYFYINPFLAICLTITLFSFVGIPPLIGFFGKQMILSAAIGNGYLFITLVAIITSVISAVYYLVVIKEIFFYNTDYILYSEKGNLSVSGGLSLMISILTMFILSFLFFYNEYIFISIFY
jgi:NADH-ubiquinone oxidoreductase chain 2